MKGSEYRVETQGIGGSFWEAFCRIWEYFGEPYKMKSLLNTFKGGF